MAKKVPASLKDREKSYYKYYAKDIVQAPQEKYDLITETPCDNASALRIEDRNDLFLPGELPGEFGWWLLENGTAVIANQTFMPGVTGEMFDWWFAWHPIDRLRYACWDNEDHYDAYLQNPERVLDMNLSIRERCWGSIHNIWEDVGLGQTDYIHLYFQKPSVMGYDESKMDTEACSSLVCANVQIVGNDVMPDVPVVMTHFMKPAEGGSVLRSRFWFGYQIMDGKAVKCIPDDVQIPAAAPLCLLRHNVKEFTNLGAILPSIYAEEKDNWV